MSAPNGRGVRFAEETSSPPPEISYGSIQTSSTASDEDEVSIDDFDASVHSFHLGGVTKIGATNVWTSVRRTPSFIEHGKEYETVPTQLSDNVKLVVDPNLDPNERGKLFYSEEAFYDVKAQPEYALTIPPDIYQRVLDEVNDASTIPFGLYFCCHGGDGAHTGVSHDDYVDISVAWYLVTFVFITLLVLSAVVPWAGGEI